MVRGPCTCAAKSMFWALLCTVFAITTWYHIWGKYLTCHMFGASIPHMTLQLHSRHITRHHVVRGLLQFMHGMTGYHIMLSPTQQTFQGMVLASTPGINSLLRLVPAVPPAPVHLVIQLIQRVPGMCM
mmetsp:Transcript_13506/g.28882  ORF Transcript_13506/g.28882 Transcript_13506/m.28882 type:complete len:128 (+) Transcript_13506:130-513(+)